MNTHDMSEVNVQNPRSPRELIEKVCLLYDVKVKDVLGRKRTPVLVSVRARIARALKDDWHMSYPAIGRELGNRDHTSIMSLYRRGPNGGYGPGYVVPSDPMAGFAHRQ